MILQDLAVAAMPKINKAIKRFSTFLEEEMEKAGRILDTIDQKVYQIFGGWEGLIKSLSAAVLLFATFTLGTALFGAIVSIKALLATVSTAILVASAVIFAKAILIALAIALVALAIEDFYVYLQGGESWFGNFKSELGWVGDAVIALGDALGWLIDYLALTWKVMVYVYQQIGQTQVWHAIIGLVYLLAMAIAVLVVAAAAFVLLLVVGIAVLRFVKPVSGGSEPRWWLVCTGFVCGPAAAIAWVAVDIFLISPAEYVVARNYTESLSPILGIGFIAGTLGAAAIWMAECPSGCRGRTGKDRRIH
jgi:hypothetical protein